MDLVTPESLGYVTRRPEDEPLPLVVPASAVLLTGRRAVVYVEVPSEGGPLFEGREVVLGPRAGAGYLVERGLAEGERVVVHGNFKIDSALQIQARPSMMLPEGTGAEEVDHSGHVSPRMARDLAAIESAFVGLTQAEALDGRREAAAALEAAVDAVHSGDLQGEALALWRELAMRLGNAAALARLAREEDDAQAAVDDARRVLERLRAAFGHHADALVEGFATPSAFRGRVDALWRAYLELHAALASDDASAAHAALTAVAQALDAVDAGALDEAAAAAWSNQRDALRDALDAPDEGADLAALRVAFEPLSAAMRRVVEAFGVASGEVYEVHCPMAFDFRGASWLQAGTEVLNPYFGDEMLRCGTVRGALPQPVRNGEPGDER
jgi:Cu(I)/Ag(I) efflux system membrane fusion protein